MSEVDTIYRGDTNPDLHLINSVLELGDSTSNDHDMSTFGGKLKGDSSTHAIGATSDNDSLQDKSVLSLWVGSWKDCTYSTLDGELVLSTESEHFGKRVSNGSADQERYSQSWGT